MEVKNPMPKYVPLVQVFSARTVLFQGAIARDLGLSTTELICFRLIALAENGTTATELAQSNALTLPAMTAIVDQLEELGFIRRERDHDDRRRVQLYPTAKGLARTDAAYVSYSRRVGPYLAGYSTADFEAVTRYLRDVEGLMREDLLARSQAPPNARKASAQRAPSPIGGRKARRQV